ncbi:MAG: alpha/beta fold hydrolase [Pseudonocardiaceae bacterium]|nr:alpha/beta fold hydrolase [Pseudonocardiaceae bacterium]
MDHLEGTRTISRASSGFWQGWLPDDDPRAVVVIVHGLGEHGGRYDHVGQHLAGAGFACYAADHCGHGRSQGRRANIGRMDRIVDDLAEFVGFATAHTPGVPVFVLGHSMGGLIALQYATGEPAELTGLVLSGAAVQVAVGSSLMRSVARLLSAVTPNLGVLTLPPEHLSRDPEVVAAYRTDPLVHHGKVPARTGAEILATTQALPERLDRLRIPVLILHGVEDRLVSPAGSRMVHQRIATEDRTLRLYDGLHHEIFNEPEQDQVLDDLIGWLARHIH